MISADGSANQVSRNLPHLPRPLANIAAVSSVDSRALISAPASTGRDMACAAQPNNAEVRA